MFHWKGQVFLELMQLYMGDLKIMMVTAISFPNGMNVFL